MPPEDRLAVQLYTLRSLSGGFGEVLRSAVAAGYRAVETVGTHGIGAAEMKDALDKHAVTVVSSHVALGELEDDLAGVLRFAAAIGNDTIVVPWLPQERRPNDAAGWRALGERLDRIGERCAEQGVQLLYHNHDFEMDVVDGQLGIAWLLEAAEDAHLGFEPDIAWIVRGGADPDQLLERFRGRCPRVHVKDLAAPGTGDAEGGWAAVGDGVLDWAHLLRLAKTAGAEWFIVEHDQPLDPVESIQRSREHLASHPAIRTAQR